MGPFSVRSDRPPVDKQDFSPSPSSWVRLPPSEEVERFSRGALPLAVVSLSIVTTRGLSWPQTVAANRNQCWPSTPIGTTLQLRPNPFGSCRRFGWQSRGHFVPGAIHVLPRGAATSPPRLCSAPRRFPESSRPPVWPLPAGVCAQQLASAT